MSLYATRRLKDGIYQGLCYAATLFGMAFLAWILIVLISKGATGINLNLFTERTLSPGSGGGLWNAILGSVIMTVAGTLIGTPIGILAGTYLAEYGNKSKLAFVVRFINDILLSAPSIVIGLFVYQVVVVPMGHFSGYAGVAALSIIVIPVVVRITEDMLRLVPTPLREASAALGMPKSMIVQKIAYKAASAGLTTGVLLAVSRISGETAPLLFTALNNSYTSVNLNAPMASLPYVIYRYAGSAYTDWQQLAWSGALIITLAVLTLSITRADARRAEDQTMTRDAMMTSSHAHDSNGFAGPGAGLPTKIAVKNLKFFYGDSLALKTINLSIHANKVTALIGPSGCGKSTLLRVMNRMYDLYPRQRAEGEVILDGQNILAPGQDLNLLRARVGMVFQKPTPFPMSIFDNIAFGIKLYNKLPSSEVAGRVEAALRGAALWNEVKDKLQDSGLSLSGGQQQRLCIARTVAVQPEVILFDEPCSALDPISTAKVEELMDELSKTYTIAIVTHSMQQAARVSSFTAFMYLGELVEFGDTKRMFTAPEKQQTQDYITGRFG